MKILFLCARFPYPPHRGDRLSAYHLLRTFSRHHDVTLLSFVDGTEPPEAAEAIGELCARVETVHLSRRRSWLQAWAGLASTIPSQVAYYRSGAMQRAVERLLGEGFDAAFAQLIRMAPYVAGHRGTPRVLFLADSLALALKRSMTYEPPWKGPGIAWEMRRMSRYESAMSKAFEETWVLSEVDREALVRGGAERVVTVPHGVDGRLFEIPLRARTSRQVYFLGNLSVPHNVDAANYLAREIWPRILSAVPDSRLILGGADPRPDVLALGALPGVTVPGAVPDLLDTWNEVAVMVAPLRFSTGIQNKVIEAMAAGVPTVTTSGVAAGIAATAQHVRIADTPHDLAAHAVAALTNPVDELERVERAREYVRGAFSWENLRARLERVAGSVREAPAAGS